MNITAATQFIHNHTDWDKTDRLVLFFDKTTIKHLESGPNIPNFNRKLIDLNPNDPITNMVHSIEEEICIDCLSIDYLLKDPFFLSLLRAYVETLVIRYNAIVSISRAMAFVIIENDLSQYPIICKTLDENIILTKKNYKSYNSEKCIFNLCSDKNIIDELRI